MDNLSSASCSCNSTNGGMLPILLLLFLLGGNSGSSCGLFGNDGGGCGCGNGLDNILPLLLILTQCGGFC